MSALFGGPTEPGASKKWMTEIGRPVEERRYAPHVWGKRYDGGIALVNIADTHQVVSLGGTYRHADGFPTSTVDLPGRHGLCPSVAIAAAIETRKHVAQPRAASSVSVIACPERPVRLFEASLELPRIT